MLFYNYYKKIQLLHIFTPKPKKSHIFTNLKVNVMFQKIIILPSPKNVLGFTLTPPCWNVDANDVL